MLLILIGKLYQKQHSKAVPASTQLGLTDFIWWTQLIESALSLQDNISAPHNQLRCVSQFSWFDNSIKRLSRKKNSKKETDG